MELENKVVIVTGAAVRLGRAQALALAKQGARLVVHYNRSSESGFT
jgi:NAD(P)-dependent dehydrogenase (short-subunit alcohol dehydrogenase family)